MISSTSKLPSWLENFASLMNSKKMKVAENNVQNLPTFNWKDETFYVQLNDDGADLYNKFATVVLHIDDAKSVEDVSKYFNDNAITASTKFEDEIPDDTQTEQPPVAEPQVGEPQVGDVVTGEDETGEEVLASEEESDDLPFELSEEDFEQVSDDEAEKILSEEPEEVPEESDEASEEIPADIAEELSEIVNDEPPTESVEETITPELTTNEEVVVEMPATAIGGETFEGAGEPVQTNEIIEHTEEVKEEVAEEGETLVEELHNILSTGEAPATEELQSEDNAVPEKNFEEMHEALIERIDTLENTINELNDTIASLKKDTKIAKNRYNRLNKKYAELYRAYQIIDNNMYDLNSQEEEMKHVNENAELTQKVIDKEHELDLSKMSDRGKLNADFLNDILTEVQVSLNDISDGVEQAIDTVVDDNIEQPDEVVQDVPQEVEVMVEEPMAEEPVEENPEFEIVLLDDPQQLKEFEDQSCPFCHEHDLKAGSSKENVTEVKCASCKKMFAVTGDKKVFYKK